MRRRLLVLLALLPLAVLFVVLGRDLAVHLGLLRGQDLVRAMGNWRVGSVMQAWDEPELRHAREIVDRLGDDAEAAERRRLLGDYLLRIGRREEGRQLLTEALATAGRAGLRGADLAPWRRALAVAWLRAGEAAHCQAMPGADSCLYPLQGGGQWAQPRAAEEAARLLEAVLADDPGNLGARWLLHVAQQAAGQEAVDPPRPAAAERTGGPRFRNIGPDLGLETFDLAGGAVLDDFDGDGRLDVIASSYDRAEPLRYLHNEGDGRLADRAEAAGLASQKGGLNLVQADYDNDGRLDLLVLRGAWMGRKGRDRNSLLHQEPDGRFTDVTEEAGLAEPALPCLAAAWADYDLDGDLDLYIGNERLDRDETPASQLFRNDGASFTDVSGFSGTENHGFTRGVGWGDYDNDGDPDLFVSNFLGPNRLYRNEGDGRFTDVAEAAGVASVGGRERSFNCWFFDADNDGWLDLFVASYPLGPRVDPAIAWRYDRPAAGVERCRLFRNRGDGSFEDVSAAAGLDRTHLVMGANFEDVDADGWPDIYLGTGAPAFETLVPNVLYRNLDGRHFADATRATRLGHLQKAHGTAFGDLDNDGDCDLYLQLGGWYLDDRYQDAVFRNEGPTGNWIVLRLEGRRANRSAIGARLRLEVETDGRRRVLHRQVGPGGSFGGNSLQVEAGLGAAERVEALEIRWPAGGRDRWQGLAARRFYRLVEGEPPREENRPFVPLPGAAGD